MTGDRSGEAGGRGAVVCWFVGVPTEIAADASIAHLAETPFGLFASTFLPITPQTPKHLGFGVFMPSKLRRDTLFGLKMPASWRNEKKPNFFLYL